MTKASGLLQIIGTYSQVPSFCNMGRASKTEQVLKLVRQAGVVRLKDLTLRGIAPVYLRRLCKRGLLVQAARGVNTVAGHEPSAHHTLASACKRVPQGVACLLTALRFHDLGTQNTADVWMAIDRKAARPKAGGLPMRFVRFSGAAFKEGVEEKIIEGVTVRITNPARPWRIVSSIEISSGWTWSLQGG